MTEGSEGIFWNPGGTLECVSAIAGPDAKMDVTRTHRVPIGRFHVFEQRRHFFLKNNGFEGGSKIAFARMFFVVFIAENAQRAQFARKMLA